MKMKMTKEKMKMEILKRNTDELQRRFLVSNLAVIKRGEGDGETFLIAGTPIVYSREAVLYEDDEFRWSEIIEPGASTEALKKGEAYLLWNHDVAQPMASMQNGTLRASEALNGVNIEADAGGTRWGRDGTEAIKAGETKKMSFALYLDADGYSREYSRDPNTKKRLVKDTIKKFSRIVDFSPVTYPAYQDTSVSARGAVDIKADIEKREAAEKEADETRAKIDSLINEYEGKLE
jgi:HK97 family phage prohead protease